ncbi:MAG: glycosyltransferase family 39 protein, partial [Gemmatimonadota bacterium]
MLSSPPPRRPSLDPGDLRYATVLNRSAPPPRPPGARDVHPPPRKIGTPARVAFLVAVLAGLFGRLYGLGGRPLAVDEYYFLSSIQAILQHGLPLLPGGGYYTRGVLLQYITAPFVMVLDDPELALRLPAVLFGLGTVLVAWFYGRRVMGPGPALLLCGLLLVSSWEIEFSRFGRMYAGFQFFALAFVASLHAALEEARGWRLVAPPLLLAGALLSHELAIFMVPLVFLPLVVPGWKRFPRRGSAWLYGLLSLAVTVPGIWFWRTDFRHWGVRARFPDGYLPTGGGSALTLPSYPFWSVADDPLLDLVTALAVILLAGALAAVVGRSRGRSAGLWAVAGALLASAILHQLAVTSVCLLLLVGWFGYFRGRERDGFVTVATLAGVLAAGAWAVWTGWLTFVVGDRGWIAEIGAGSFRSAFFKTFAWPDPYPVFFESWRADLPLLGTVILAAIVVQVVTKLRRPPVELASNPGWVLVYFFLALGVTDPFFSTTRYTHFLYPIGLTVLVLSSVEMARLAASRWRLGRRLGPGTVATGVVALIFAASADFNPAHIARVGTPDVAFRQGAFQRFEELWYARRDYAS